MAMEGQVEGQVAGQVKGQAEGQVAVVESELAQAGHVLGGRFVLERFVES